MLKIIRGGGVIPRPRKWRIVEFIPEDLHFVPHGRRRCQLEEEVLKVEEIEAVRLKDLVGLNQDECAERMQVSRQTFQRILTDARIKIARALIKGRAIRAAGGDFTRHVCRVHCPRCNKDWEESYEKFKTERNDYRCPKCGSGDITCCGRKKGGSCKNENCHP